MNKQIKTRQEKGITLIALIITIVVLLILAVVAIRAVQDGGIIDYAKNARDDYQKTQDEEETMLQNYLNILNEETKSETEEGETDSSSKITWTKTNEGYLEVGSKVVTSTGENFYVIGFEGDNDETVKLLAEYNLKVDGSAQDTTGADNPCAFSASGDFTADENLNNNSTIKADTTSAVYKAMQYGETLGLTTGRLMTVGEVEALGGSKEDYSTSGCNENGYNWINTTNYWLGSPDREVAGSVFGIFYEGEEIYGTMFEEYDYFGVRPVIEIFKSNILTDSSSKITWTKTSEGDLAVGSTVKTSTNEEFYVIGFAGINNETVKLLAKNNLKADGSAQDNTGAWNPCAFSAAGGFAEYENLNNNSTVKADTTSAVYKAMQYGETLGLITGRLMLKSEAEKLESANSDILYGENGKSSGTFLNYWLGSAGISEDVWNVHYSALNGDYHFDDHSSFGVRPVVEILKSNIS